VTKAVTLSVLFVAAALAVVATVYGFVGIKEDRGVEAAGGMAAPAVDQASLVAAIDLALSSQDPELLSGLASAWSRSEPPKGVLRVDEEAHAYAFGWTLAIERVTGSTPTAFM